MNEPLILYLLKSLDDERRQFIKHLVLLSDLSKEYMFDVLTDKIQAEIIRQSKSPYNLEYAFDILEASERIACMEITSATIKFIRSHLDSYKVLKALLNDRHLTIETTLKMKSIVLSKLLDEWPNATLFDEGGNEYKEEAMLLTKELCY